MRPASNKCLPGTDLTLLGLRRDTLIVFFSCFVPARIRVKDVQGQYTPLIFRHDAEQRTLLRVMKIKMLFIYMHRRRIDVWVVCLGSWEDAS